MQALNIASFPGRPQPHSQFFNDAHALKSVEKFGEPGDEAHCTYNNYTCIPSSSSLVCVEVSVQCSCASGRIAVGMGV